MYLIGFLYVYFIAFKQLSNDIKFLIFSFVLTISLNFLSVLYTLRNGVESNDKQQKSRIALTLVIL